MVKVSPLFYICLINNSAKYKSLRELVLMQKKKGVIPSSL